MIEIIVCLDCDGDGKIHDDKTCSSCNGKGTKSNIGIGDKVTYNSFNKKEHGIIKSIPLKNGYAFVVYHCGGDWENYQNYTAAMTNANDLTLGWN